MPYYTYICLENLGFLTSIASITSKFQQIPSLKLHIHHNQAMYLLANPPVVPEGV
jgi:hypothetical protein